MDKNQLVDAMSNEAAMTKADARKALDAYIKVVASALMKGGKVTLIGFGEFSVDKSTGVATVRFEAGQNLRDTVAQSAANASDSGATACAYSLSKTSQSLGASKSGGCVSVVTGVGCAWQASSDSAWLALTSGATQTGNGSVCFEALANPDKERRVGRISIDGRVFVVNQGGRARPVVPGKPTYQ
jgi:nucleoid DNA-binding protein